MVIIRVIASNTMIILKHPIFAWMFFPDKGLFRKISGFRRQVGTTDRLRRVLGREGCREPERNHQLMGMTNVHQAFRRSVFFCYDSVKSIKMRTNKLHEDWTIPWMFQIFNPSHPSRSANVDRLVETHLTTAQSLFDDWTPWKSAGRHCF